MASRCKKSKGRGRVGPSTLAIIAPLMANATSGGDLSYLPPPTTVLGATLCNVLLVTNVGVPLSLIGSPQRLVMERSVLIDEKEVKKEEEKGIRALKKKGKSGRLYPLLQ